ncbi:MAG: hypothetical protein D6719_01885 [Candidatus Dadabacteria bacterium]|nr:MAG: hypothetical protein D6719_01885 [Candidatus Dadabacteria bacterium]
MAAYKKKLHLSAPDAFSLFPHVVLLPVCGDVGKLAGYTSALYARYEKVAAIRKEVGEEVDRRQFHKLEAEHAMLKQVLDWLKIKPENEGV